MPNFESPIGSRKFAGSAMRDFEVPDEDLSQQSSQMRSVQNLDQNMLRNFQSRIEESVSNIDEEREIMAAREARRSGREKISDGAKRRIEVLLGMVQTTREVDIDGNLFILRSLKSKEMRDALMATAEYDGTVQAPYEIRRQILSRSLTHVAGVEIEQFVASNSLSSKLLFLDELDESLISRLYDEYVELSKTAKEKFSIKNDKEVQEVVEDIKK